MPEIHPLNLAIRKAQPGDAPAIADLLRQMGWFRHMAAESPVDSAARVERHLELCLADSSHSVYVAADGEAEGSTEVLGYASVHWLPYLFMPAPEGYLSELFVSEAARGQGVGARLLRAVQEEARQRGCYRLSLLNGKQRESYQRGFYLKQGWEERPGMANFVFWLKE